ncbi:ABC transporter permease [Clostridium saccharoperbutylacetonicum]|jgi:NitT/TauT family transport system permease protein|uniref:ABC-type nitrate/sulfonate/bicarbonate transport system, permease component n=1 Tax=Clostridium saccharoperbutylacetonicum N1-4(HMT) TaxID=931276 RepID=M1LXB1_9CLOT|nr:ABC transporter permease [Clostridium saccharoperbutylacetonicum]AGF57890.1 ABC-type nitrate/sulfonate/bicarbonate transport system, permease component [Clostridium saccharoperbutylacetonicum N1-4(HMT)]AQR96565.1 putative aliphatic sulfonates transport permease protein SsuC [Clostridium saccharoperbutylacetonicum]NRT61337.1 NitT/TauT family transport system permease protein [Clostridium saccharoperbutylacetonicum]NSB24654.1 NitT/TauT family transport system permease protein [Clostridium sacc
MITKKEKYKINLVWTIGIILVWELIAFFLDKVAKDPMASAKLPYPHVVVMSIAQNFSELMGAAGLTFSRAVMGFTLGTIIGVLLAIVMSLSKIAEKISLPYLIISQMVPVLGLAPIIFTLVKDMDASRIVIAAYITFFPVSINMLSGLNSVDNEKKELLYSYAAQKKSIYCKLMIPYSLPYLFAGLKIAAPMSITASILIDMLGSSGGIGVKLLYSLYSGTKDVFWASVFTSAFMGIISYFIVILAEKILIPWRKQTI